MAKPSRPPRREPSLNPSSDSTMRKTAARSHPALCESFGYCLVKSGIFLRALMDDALRESKIVAPQFAILTILIASGPMSQIEIGTVLLIDKATVVKLIDDLEGQRFVTRIADRADRRIKRIQISAAGRRMNTRASSLRSKLEKEALAPLSTKERKFLAIILPKLLDHLREMTFAKS